MAYDRTQLAEDDIATASATVRNNLNKTANMVMVDFGIPPGFDLLSEDLQDYQEKSASRNAKSGHLSKFSLTATRAILYFDSFAPGDTVTVRFRLRAKYPIRARTFKSRVYEYYDPEVSRSHGPCNWKCVSASRRPPTRKSPNFFLDERIAHAHERPARSWRSFFAVSPLTRCVPRHTARCQTSTTEILSCVEI